MYIVVQGTQSHVTSMIQKKLNFLDVFVVLQLAGRITSKIISKGAKRKKYDHPSSSTVVRKPLKNTPCLYPGCDMEFFFKTKVIEHLQNVHPDIDVKNPIEKDFTSLEEFRFWKEEEQQRTFSLFTSKKGQTKSSVKYFYCQHDGLSHTKRKSNRCNQKGQIKVGHV